MSSSHTRPAKCMFYSEARKLAYRAQCNAPWQSLLPCSIARGNSKRVVQQAQSLFLTARHLCCAALLPFYICGTRLIDYFSMVMINANLIEYHS